MPDRIRDLVGAARRELARAPHRPATREAVLLLGRVLELTEAEVLARFDEPVPGAQARRFRDLLRRRLAGEPVAYILGEKEFFGRPFRVDRRVLIPRPETEHLVETALGLPLPTAPRILDVGTGSGCLAVTLALEIPEARLTATDLSVDALAVARVNARRHGVGRRVTWVATDLATAFDLSRLDLVVSNPPYIGPAEAPDLPAEVRDWEPPLALFAPGAAGAALERLLAALARLRAGAFALLEIGRGQLPEIRAGLAASALRLERVVPDYSGIPRVVVLRRRRA